VALCLATGAVALQSGLLAPGIALRRRDMVS
jgi:hypothetical protein